MHFSVKQLYRRIVLLLCATLMVLLTTLLSVVTLSEQRSASHNALQLQANMLADDLAASPGAHGAELKRKLLTAAVNREIALVCAINAETGAKTEVRGAAYGNLANPPGCGSAAGINLQDSLITARATITNGELPTAAGEVILIAERQALQYSLWRWLLISAGISGLFGIICWAAGLRFERVFLRPIRHISSTAQRVTMYKDYTLRVIPDALSIVPSEIDSLTQSFNAMLHEIDDRDQRLTRKGEELEKSRQAAIAANQAKSMFLANVSHELRTPLNAILGFSTMLMGEQFGPIGSPKYKEYASDIHDSGKHLLDVINDILDITKAETGALKITIEQLNLAKIIEKALNIISGQAHERKIDIYTDLPAKMPKIYADRVRLIQIMLNVLSNAIKFSHEGGKVTIRAQVESGKNGIYYFTLEIEDQGIGMTQAEVTRAFATFNQSDAGLNRKYEGAGLGLPLTKRLVELHHGKIKIHSKKDEGTTVTIRLTSDPALLP